MSMMAQNLNPSPFSLTIIPSKNPLKEGPVISYQNQGELMRNLSEPAIHDISDFCPIASPQPLSPSLGWAPVSKSSELHRQISLFGIRILGMHVIVPSPHPSSVYQPSYDCQICFTSRQMSWTPLRNGTPKMMELVTQVRWPK